MSMYQWMKKVTVILVILGKLMADDRLLKTPSGPIRGTTTKGYTGKEVDVFYGIPYADPPVGILRFGAPVEVKSWQDELNATAPSSACYQKKFLDKDYEKEDSTGWIPKRPWSEDCLKLHIWVPRPRRTNCTVLVYIHGGGFVGGHPLTPVTTGATLAAEEKVIVVSVSYRINVQGFLYLGIPEAPGNMGLMDQQMALKWVRRNIVSFGGNPDAVTMFGLSAGGASVGFQLLSHGSRNLFKRAILMSGTPNAVWAIQTNDDALGYSMKLASSFGCTSSIPKDVLLCLQSVDADKLSDWNKDTFMIGSLEFIPTVDGHFITDYPITLLSKKEVIDADVMIGNTADEGSAYIPDTVLEITQFTDVQTAEKQFQTSVSRNFKKSDKYTINLVSLLYTDWTRRTDPLMWRDAVKDFMSDHQFHCASSQFADQYLSTGNTVYRYIVDHHFEKLPYPKWMGTPHATDTLLHLGAAAGGGRYGSPEEVTLSRRVMRWFANFARTGDPNGPGQSGPTWHQSTMTGNEYMRIAVESVMANHFRTQQCTMVNKIMAAINDC